MSLLVLLARLLLAAVFLLAGLTKLADLAGSRQALRDTEGLLTRGCSSSDGAFRSGMYGSSAFVVLQMAELFRLMDEKEQASNLGGKHNARSRSCKRSMWATGTS